MACIVWVLWQTIISPLQRSLYTRSLSPASFCLELWPKEYMWSSERDCQAWGHFKDFQHISLTHIACRFCLWVLIKLATFSQSLIGGKTMKQLATTGQDRTVGKAAGTDDSMSPRRPRKELGTAHIHISLSPLPLILHLPLLFFSLFHTLLSHSLACCVK